MRFVRFGTKKRCTNILSSYGIRILCNWLASLFQSPYSFASLRCRSFALLTSVVDFEIFYQIRFLLIALYHINFILSIIFL